MTSRDPKRSRLWSRYLCSSISQQPCKTHGRFILTTLGNHTLGIQWSHDRWRHVTRKVKVVIPISLKLNISITVRDRRSVQIDHGKETPYCESNGHVKDEVTWPQNVKVVTPVSLRLKISTTVRSKRWIQIEQWTVTPTGNHILPVQWSGDRWYHTSQMVTL